MKKLSMFLLVLMLLPFTATAVTNNFTITVTTTFTPLHTFFMAATGCNDANSGTSAASPWCTPNHNLVCGDVIIAAPGSYGTNSAFGTVSNCPSTSGGIDGTGGIWFAVLLCGGADLEACNATGFNIQSNNWAIEGFKSTAGSGNNYIIDATASGTTQIHHIAFINDISYNSQQGFQGNEGALNHNVPGNGVDYFAFVGLIAQNSAQSGFGVAGINVVAPSQFDSVAGTHIYVAGNFSYTNRNEANDPSGDGEAYMADSLDAHGYSAKVVWANNIGFNSTRYCWQVFQQNFNVSTPTLKIYNTSCYGNLQTVNTDSADGEFNFFGTTANLNWSLSMTNNLAQTNAASSSGHPIYALVIGGTHWTAITDTGNFFNGLATSCASGTCNSVSSPFSATYFNSNVSSGSDTYTTPSYTNVSDLLSNRTGVPTCTGKENTVQCMGWDAVTGTLTTPSIISDLVPTATGTSGKGYQKPTMTCAADADFPVWLKGVVYLHWTGSIVQQRAGLVNMPCGM